MASCISQLKWHRYRRERDLPHIDQFDGASRGPFGALNFLLHTGKQAPWAALGALLTVFSLAMDPFAQQVLGTGLGSTVQGTDAKMPTAYMYGTRTGGDSR